MTSAPRAWRPLRHAGLLCLGIVTPILSAGAAHAQEAKPSSAEQPGAASEPSEIVVTANRLRGEVGGAIPAETSIDTNAVQALGASNVGDVIAQLSAQAGGTQGRAGEGSVVLLNGRRISSLAEIRNLPPEAVSRVDVLPEEAALRFGYPAHQKVINVVLQPSFASATVELEDRVTEAATRNDFNTEVNLVRIAGDNRMTLDLQYQIGDDVSEARRGIAGRPPGDAALRTLVPLTRQFDANGVFARALNGGLGFTGNLSVDRLTSRALLGPLQSDPGKALARTTTTDTGHLGSVFNGALAGWNWSITSNLDHVATTIDTAADGPRPARSSRGIDDTIAIDGVAHGTVFALPAGDVGLSVQAGASGERLSARDESGAGRKLTRRMFDGQFSLELPLLDKNSPVGALTAGVNAAAHDYSDTSVPLDRGWTLNWAPRPRLSLLVSGSRESAPATVRQLGDPITATPGVRFYDYATGQSTTAARLDGGDPGLRHDVRTLFKAEATFKPAKTASLIAAYTQVTTRDAILAFPGISSEMEAAFPQRILRDANGAIASVDARPLNIANETRKSLRFGINFNRSWQAPGSAGGPKMPGGGNFGGGHYFGAGGTTLQFALYDTIRLSDRVVLAAGQAPIDLLGNNLLGEGLRAPRHSVDAQLSATHHGFGLRAFASWKSAETVAPGLPGQLRFGEPVTLNLRLFFFPDRQEGLRRRLPWIEGVRFLLAIDNLLDQAPDVRDRMGGVPLAYQRGYLDPLGRAFRLSMRKTWR
jgi:iron complex outermembrane recepter protein